MLELCCHEGDTPETEHRGRKTQTENRTIERQRGPGNNAASFNIFPVQSTTQPCFSAPRQNREETERERQNR